MATHTIGAGPWLAGTVVNVYVAEAWVDQTTTPSGSTVAAGTVTSSGAVTFTGLDEQRRYVAYAAGLGVTFRTSPPNLQVRVAVPDRERLAELESQREDALAYSVAMVFYDSGWGDRPEAAHVIWVGGVESPPIGGDSGAVEGADFWWQP